MAHQKDLLDTQFIEETDKVTDDVECRVGRDGGRGVGVAVATKVRGNGPVAAGREVEELLAPGVPEFREAVKEKDGWAGPYRCHVHVYAVRGHRCVLYFLHFSETLRCCLFDSWSYLGWVGVSEFLFTTYVLEVNEPFLLISWGMK